MYKWISWALRLVATAVLLSFLCIWTTGYIVNSYMESIIKQLELPLETKPFALSGVWGTLWGADSDTPVKEAGKEARTANAKATDSDIGVDDPDEQDDPKEQATATSPASSASNGQASASETPDVGTTTQEQQPNSGEERRGDDVPAVSGIAGEGDRQMTDAERQALYANVVSKLDASQLQLLSEALQGGVSADKLAQLKEMLKAALTADEYDQMMETLQGTATAE
ncbi:MAG: hypothetical protein J7559_11570 [Cohnella sp.]|nr:hypothetical protein [Cohnella sp.]